MLSLGPRGLLKSAPRTNPFQAKTSIGYASTKKQSDGIRRIVQKNETKRTCLECKSRPITGNEHAITSRLVSAPLVSAFHKFHYSTTSGTKHTISLPPLVESISSGTVFSIEKPKGSQASADDVVIIVETEKIQVEIRTPCGGIIESILVSQGDTVEVGQDLFVVVEGASIPSPQTEKGPEESSAPQASSPQEQKPPRQERAEQKSSVDPSGKGSSAKSRSPPTPSQKPPDQSLDRTDTRIRMTQARKRTAIRLKESQNMAAMLTTFNEVDMQELTNFRNLYKDRFQEKYGVKLGFMSAFTKASAVALTEIPIVNATIDGDEIVYHSYVDISVAVSTPTSLVVPVIRNVQSMSFDQIELAINQFAKKARDNKLTIDDMSGGTFTISNGGVFGSLMGTPIINPPQSAILGMHAINKRPTVVNDQILVRPMMYLALTYDHRLIDGRDAVTFLKRIKTLIEDPTSLLLNV